MDPNTTLAELRKLSKHVHETTAGIDNYTDRLVLHDLTEEAENFATLFDALDQWMSKHGFPPDAWPEGGTDTGTNGRRRSSHERRELQDDECADCPGWDFFETNDRGLEIERCDSCARFPDDRAAAAHVLWMIAQAITGSNHTHAVRLLGSGGTARQWEELDQ